jgi:hypothetical protein
MKWTLRRIEALSTRPADIVVENELIHDLLQQRQIPATAAHALDLFVG